MTERPVRIMFEGRQIGTGIVHSDGTMSGDIDLTPGVSPCPECRAGKHPNCGGDTWDDTRDSPAPCPCYVADPRAHLFTNLIGNQGTG